MRAERADVVSNVRVDGDGAAAREKSRNVGPPLFVASQQAGDFGDHDYALVQIVRAEPSEQLGQEVVVERWCNVLIGHVYTGTPAQC